MKDILVKALRFNAIKPRHTNKWVAVEKKSGEVISAADSLSEVLTRSTEVKNKTVFKVLPHIFAGGGA